MRCYLEADALRIWCKVHGATAAEVPWARCDVGFTRDFDDQVAWLAVHSSQKAIVGLMRISWRTVGSIVQRISDGGHDVIRSTGCDGSGSMRSGVRHEALQFRAEMKGLRRWSSHTVERLPSRDGRRVLVRIALGAAGPDVVG